MALALMIGVGASLAMIQTIGARAIMALVLRASWWLPVVVILHIPQTLCSALGWRSLLAKSLHPRVDQFYVFRWVRESVNSLLPVAQIGGDLVRGRLLARTGPGLEEASVSCVLDVTLELAAQVIFTLLAFTLLISMVSNLFVERFAITTILILAASVVGLFCMTRTAASYRLRMLVARLASRSGLGHDAPYGSELRPAFRPNSGQLLRSTLWHLLSWMFGGLETFAAFMALGLHGGLREATIVEGMGQIVRTAGFAVPGALGVQEGGLVLICGLFGIAPASAIAISLLRRIRELALGLPGLAVWHRLEGRSRRPHLPWPMASFDQPSKEMAHEP